MAGRRQPTSVAVVGAGLAGLAAARRLAAAGCAVRVFDKARGPGGRMATRREAGLAFDHGAQYFTARAPAFREAVAGWRRRGLAGVWPVTIARLPGNGPHAPARTEPLVGVPGMSALCRALAEPLATEYGATVAAVTRTDGAWTLTGADGRALGRCDRVVIGTPPAQAAPLLAGAPGLARRAASVVMRSCWAVMLAFAERLELPWDAAFVNEPPLSWIARNAAKPGRPAGETWVLHASPSWSEANLESDGEAVAATLLGAFFATTGARPVAPTRRIAHRWRYARAARPLAAGHLLDPERGIGACGDWCRGDRVEDAFLSGSSLAEAMRAGA